MIPSLELSQSLLAKAYQNWEPIPVKWHEHDYKTLTLCFACNAKPICKDCCDEHFARCL